MPPQVVHVKDAGKVASALANEKCQRILEYLRDNEDATETVLAKTLNMPISTVHYNMKTLVEAKLVKSDTYSYSAKGKEVTHYRINRNPIVIVQALEHLSLLRTIVPAALIAAGAAFVYDLVQRQALLTPSVASQALEASPMIAEESSAMMQDSVAQGAQLAMKTTAPMIEQVQEPSMLPWFLAGIMTVLVLSFIITLLRRVKENRN